jgi:hypothetical protein
MKFHIKIIQAKSVLIMNCTKLKSSWIDKIHYSSNILSSEKFHAINWALLKSDRDVGMVEIMNI